MGFFYELYHACRRIIFEPLYLLSGYTPSKYRLSAEEEEFIEVNRRYWSELTTGNNAPTVLVYGHMAGEGANYLMRLGLISRSIAEEIDGKIQVVLPRCGYNSHRIVELFRSFGIREFIFLREMDWNIRARLRAMFLALRWIVSAKSGEDVLKFSVDGIDCGDVLYNQILKEKKGRYTIEKVTFSLLPPVFRLYLHFTVYKDLLNRLSASTLVTTHIQYTMYGPLVRLALLKGMSVVETTDLATATFRKEDLPDGVNFFSYTRKALKRVIEEFPEEELIAVAETELKARIGGELSQMDVQLAYGAHKRNISEDELRRSINETSGRPIACVFAHVFADAPVGGSERTLFRDYYHWLVETLKIVSRSQNVHWLVKPHPAQKLYGEYGDFLKLLAQCNRESRNENLSLCPEDVSTATLIRCAKSIITSQGTIGLECSCFGVPAIIAGRPFYRGFGFAHEPETREEYQHLLLNVANLSSLSRAQTEKAKIVYGAFSRVTKAHDSDLIDPQLLDLVWGYTVKADSNAAYLLLASRLKKFSPREQALFTSLTK